MASAIGRINTALATVHNENQAALAALNFDFTLVKLEAPAEYNGLGATISRRRKIDAEEGSLHKTARRLGALFGDLLPQTDDLFRAYGTRVSEISSLPSINPRDNHDKSGIFGSHMGADTTSIWAAVTSGSAAIAVHLLGCMLARTFTGPEAISLWVELVQKQKERIACNQESRLYSTENSAAKAAAQQEILRSDLASWDASVRAWLQSADEAKAFQHKQTMLILNNASVPVNSEADTYSSVIKAWKVALEAMNNLLKGMPQRVQDGAALLAISSWHLYPDMIVYGGPCVEVKQKDPLFNRAGLLTLGLQQIRDDSKSVYWSLPLACMQYYGHPVQASRAVGPENSRISYRQFAYIVLGCVFHGWKEYAPNNKEGLRWIRRLGTILDVIPDHAVQRGNSTRWLNYLLDAVAVLHDCDEAETRAAHQLMHLGRRRPGFLNLPTEVPPPLFGMAQIDLFLSVLSSDECRVICLRRLCHHLKLDGSNFLIQYQLSKSEARTEYASVEPAEDRVHRTDDENAIIAKFCLTRRARWISLSKRDLKLCVERSHDFEDISQAVKKLWALERLHKKRSSDMTSDISSRERKQEIENLQAGIAIHKRRLEIEQLGEICLPVFESHKEQLKEHECRHWELRETDLLFGKSTDFLSASREILSHIDRDEVAEEAVSLTFYMGDMKLAGMFSLTSLHMKPSEKLVLPPSYLNEVFTSDNIDIERILYHFSTLPVISCLRACGMMAEIYRLLPGASISTLVVKLPLYTAKWVPKHEYGSWRAATYQQGRSSLTLREAFACVAMFESGICNIDPDSLSEVFAMSSGNSLYVAAALLCDPSEQPGSAELRRVVGNIGRSGITFLISPPEVKTRDPDPEKWMAINHNTFDGKFENYFRETSMHLSLTAYELPLATDVTQRHIIDRDAVLVEALISIYDGGSWVAEVDVLRAFDTDVLRFEPCQLTHHRRKTYEEVCQNLPELAATSIENWDELIEAPDEGVVAVKAHKNWVARLAAVAFCARYDFFTLVLPDDVCWSCCVEEIPAGRACPKVALIC